MAVLKAVTVVLKAVTVVPRVVDMVVLLREDMVACRRRLVGSMVARLRDIRRRVGISNRDQVVMVRLRRLRDIRVGFGECD